MANENKAPPAPPITAKPVLHSASIDSAVLQGNSRMTIEKHDISVMVVRGIVCPKIKNN